MSTNLYAYPYDPTGVLPSNKIPPERHTLTPVKKGDYNFIVPKAAPFFSNSVRIRHVASSTTLIHGVDYYYSHRFLAAQEVTGEAVYGSITFIDRNLAGDIDIEYRTMGGASTVDQQTLLTILAGKRYDPRALVWGVDVIVPTTFPAAPHLTDGEDTVGMEEYIQSMLGVEKAIRGSVSESHQHRPEQVKGLNASLSGKVNLNGPRKIAVSEPISIVDYSGLIYISLPDVIQDTDVQFRVTVIDRSDTTELVFYANIKGKGANRIGSDYPVRGTIQKGYLSDRNITFEPRYTDDRLPYIALNVGRLINSLVMITEVTLNTTYSRAYNVDWVLSMPGGNALELPSKVRVIGSASLDIDDAQSGTLKADTLWLVDASTVRTRALPIIPPNGTIVSVKDDSNLASVNPAIVQGRIKLNGTVESDVQLDVSNGWFTLQYEETGDVWFIIEGG